MKEFINERIAERLKSAMDSEEKIIDEIDSIEKDDDEVVDINNGIITTEEELEGFYIVKAILREVADISKLQYKKTKNYLGINLDGKVSQTICRLRFNVKKKCVGIIDTNGKEVKQEIVTPDGIYGVAEFLKDRIIYLTEGKYIKESRNTEA